MTDLFSSTKIGLIPLSNRIIMAPLTRAPAGIGGFHWPLASEYYWKRASADLSTTELANVSTHGRGYDFRPSIYKDAHTEGWKSVTAAVHDAAGCIVLQLWHTGRISAPA